MSFEITVITPDGKPAEPRRVDAATARTLIDQAAADGQQLRIRPTSAAHAAEPESGRESLPAAGAPQ
ncbi:hypothetical protein [Yinghuangia soli]|uniref:Uncharacterized protein n=1 Tax=Yinghuangia soli TaxID=2908204 RepID=A0AA41Q4K3_9ACTN|nr:hypothetical protein [Yinghuangia soli]MCF2531438.1 hypothetical protein [Yinghuangia soli]